MVCEGNCGIGSCKNFGIEDGTPYCLEGGTPRVARGSGATFRAAKQSVTGEMEQLQKQFADVFKIVDKYRRLCMDSRKAQYETLKAKVEAMISRVRVLALKQQYEARRYELTMRHPAGFMSDLGYHFSDDALELGARAQETRQEFSSYGDLITYYDKPNYGNSLLANPMKLAALRLAACE